MLDLLDYVRFIESTQLLGLRPLHMEKLAPRHNLIIMCS
jgi:hypothetical protein